VTKEILDDGVVFDKEGKEMTISSKGIVVLAMGATPVNDLAERIKGKVAEIYVVGDAKTPRKALEAIAEGACVARLI
jgi:2,4-dienoyl-CoA reductase (NADPH2)